MITTLDSNIDSDTPDQQFLDASTTATCKAKLYVKTDTILLTRSPDSDLDSNPSLHFPSISLDGYVVKVGSETSRKQTTNVYAAQYSKRKTTVHVPDMYYLYSGQKI